MSDRKPKGKLRLVSIEVRAHVMFDKDGELTPVESAPFVVPARDLDTFAETLRADLADQEARLNADGDDA